MNEGMGTFAAHRMSMGSTDEIALAWVRRAPGRAPLENTRVAGVVPSIRGRVACEKNGRTERRADESEEELGADRLLVVDRG